MSTSPGALNPLSFDSEQELKDELRKQGQARGYTPLVEDDDDEPELKQSDNVDDVLAHYGVKGMKWGVRTARTTVETPRQKDFRAAYERTSRARRILDGKPDASGVTRKDVRKARREAAKEVRRNLEDFEDLPGKTRDVEIKNARREVRKVSREYADAKSEIKSRKQELGKNEVKRQLAEAGKTKMETIAKADMNTRAETAVEVAIAVGQAVARDRERRRVDEAQRQSPTPNR